MLEGYGDQLALVDVEGARRKVNIGMLPVAPPPGQWVLIHMGFAVETVDAAGAAAALSGLELLGRARADAADDSTADRTAHSTADSTDDSTDGAEAAS
jgi:hydrogenase assembly chaperone HypC/HupF